MALTVMAVSVFTSRRKTARGAPPVTPTTNVVYQTLIKLCVDICKRNGKKKLIWFGDKDKTLNYSPKSDEMILTVHRWFANKSWPGNWMDARMGDLANKVTAQLGTSSDTPVKTSGTQAKVLDQDGRCSFHCRYE